MIRRISLVTKLPELTREEFFARWTGEHVEIARRLPGLRGYSILILDGEDAALRWDRDHDVRLARGAERAFAVPELAEGLARTRDEFAASVEVFFAEEHPIVTGGGE